MNGRREGLFGSWCASCWSHARCVRRDSAGESGCVRSEARLRDFLWAEREAPRSKRWCSCGVVRCSDGMLTGLRGW